MTFLVIFEKKLVNKRKRLQIKVPKFSPLLEKMTQRTSPIISDLGEGNGNPLQYSCLRWRSLVGCSPWGRYESDTTEQLHFHFSLSCIGEGNGNPLQCSCLENPRDRGAWWATVYGVTQSRTRLKRLSSSSSSTTHIVFIYMNK